MPIPPPRELRIGRIIDETLRVLEMCMLPALVYLLVMTAANVAVTIYGLEHGAIRTQLVLGAASMIIGIVAGFFLLEAILRRMGHLRTGASDSFLPFIGLSLISTVAVVVGLILLIIPGLIVMARWSVAQPMLLAGGSGVTESLKASWERTRGHEFAIIVAALALIAVFIVVTIFASFVYGDEDLVGIIVTQLASTGIGVVLIAVGVALYRLILGSEVPSAPEGRDGRIGP